MDQQLSDLLFWSLVGGALGFAVFCFIMGVIQYKKNTEKRKDADQHQDPASVEPGFTTVTIRATVADQTCCVRTIGFKIPKTVKEFFVVFQTEKGETIRLQVPEEMYDGFATGQTGILTVVDGELYGFDPEDTGCVSE